MLVDDKSVILTESEFKTLPEYSCSIPSGTVIGKQWKMNRHAYTADFCARCKRSGRKLCPKHKRDDWLMCEYIADPDPKMVGIKYREILEVVPDPKKKAA